MQNTLEIITNAIDPIHPYGTKYANKNASITVRIIDTIILVSVLSFHHFIQVAI